MLNWSGALLVALVAGLLAQPNASEREVRVAPLADPATCLGNRILPDPGARRAVVWEAPRDIRGPIRPTWPGEFVVAELPHDAGVGAALRMTFVGASVRVEPLRWNANGDRLLFRVGEHSAYLYDPAARAVRADAPLDPIWRTRRIEALSHGDLAFHARPDMLAMLRRIESEGAAVRTIATIAGDDAAFLVFRSGNRFRLTAYQGDRRWDTGIPIAFTSAPMLVPGTRRPLFLGDQAGYSTFLPYALPLIDRATGRVAGRFGAERIELNDGRVVDLLPHFNQVMAILDASADGDTILALVDLEREKRMVRISGGDVQSWRFCEKRGIQVRAPATQVQGGVPPTATAPASPPGYFTRPANWLPEDAPAVRSLIRFQGGGAPRTGEAFGYLFRPVRGTGQLVVYFHGGPTETLADRMLPSDVTRFLRHGIAVLAVEQSGMLGGGLALSERLPRLGVRALREDVAAVTDWARRSGYRQRYLIGDSFGGASAVIAAVEHAGDYEHIFARAPLLALHGPDRTVVRGEMVPNNVLPSSQREFEETVYGGASGRARFSADVQAYARRLSPTPRLSFYFGSRDPVSAVTDLPPAFAGHPSVLIARGSHGEVGGASAVVGDILSKLGIDASRQEPALIGLPVEQGVR